MTVKTNGAEFKRFYDDSTFWPKDSDTYHDDAVLAVNGLIQQDGIDPSTLPDEALVTIDGGVVFDAVGGGEPSLETYFRRWKKLQTAASFLVECDLSKVDAVKAAIRAAGGRVAS